MTDCDLPAYPILCPPPTTTTAVGAPRPLPRTGQDVSVYTLAGVALVIIGCVLMIVAQLAHKRLR